VTPIRPGAELARLIDRLRTLPTETEWLEFKVNKCDPREIGEYISALSNSAAICGHETAYLIWGIRDSDHAMVGTTFDPQTTRQGNEMLENWLTRLLEPQVMFTMADTIVDGRRFVILEIAAARHQPVKFSGIAYVRIGFAKKPLSKHPEHERMLWRSFDTKPFEMGIALTDVDNAEVVRLLDYPAYFDIFHLPLPTHREGIITALNAEQFITETDSGQWNITNLGAIMFARNLNDYDGLSRKALRIIHYRADDRLTTIREISPDGGYACSFARTIEQIMDILPTNEVIDQSLRKAVPMYPVLAIRELVANALIHQDFPLTGTGPMVEIFDSRIEITNPGIPLLDPNRFVDAPPRSRNERLASKMRRAGICEERGSGWDKVGLSIELYQLPAPLITQANQHTRVTLFSPRVLAKMDRDDRMRATYLHTCLKYVNNDFATNASIRQRFGIEPRNSATASRILREAVDAGLITVADPDSSPKNMRYVPHWAAESQT
jgi:ATP-dependent DNA helicase RecG